MPNLLPTNQLQVRQFDSSKRLLVYQREYLVLEKIFADNEGLQDWLTLNTLLSHHAITMLCSQGQLMYGDGIDEECLQLAPRMLAH